jgi:hypothetical protein
LVKVFGQFFYSNNLPAISLPKDSSCHDFTTHNVLEKAEHKGGSIFDGKKYFKMIVSSLDSIHFYRKNAENVILT